MRDGRHKHEGMEPDAAREYLDPWAHYFEEHHPQKIHHTGLTEAKVEEIMHYIIGSLRGAGAEATRDARLAGAPTGRPRASRRRPGSSTAAARAGSCCASSSSSRASGTRTRTTGGAATTTTTTRRRRTNNC